MKHFFTILEDEVIPSNNINNDETDLVETSNEANAVTKLEELAEDSDTERAFDFLEKNVKNSSAFVKNSPTASNWTIMIRYVISKISKLKTKQ
jgi:hypothetical protein